jgi:hypothetical protein
MSLYPLRPPLYVVQATIADEDGQRRTTARCCPSAPFGTPAWQMPIIAGYLVQLRRSGLAPASESFDTYLEERRTSPVPAPHLPYAHAAWHDTRVTCLIDVALTAKGAMGWPAVSLVVMQQEVGRGRCSWSGIERRIGYHSVIQYTQQEIVTEELRIRERLRTSDNDGLRDVHDLAAHVASWTEKVHAAARADHTSSRAKDVRAAKAGGTRSPR